MTAPTSTPLTDAELAHLDNGWLSGTVLDDEMRRAAAEIRALRASEARLLAALKELLRYYTDTPWRDEMEAHANEVTAGNVSHIEMLESRCESAIAAAEGRAE